MRRHDYFFTFVQHNLSSPVSPSHPRFFVHSDNCGLHHHLLPRHPSAHRNVVDAFSASPFRH
ncbi:hypothetical protein U9M48_007713 [Paspalum notatum var. saurae]|uniref:Uncharacterized protein n=1 Tax=Paspalum notatum var. saurae TaxID=547442 RepID=A0AAQ3WBZ9_PASNO